MKNYLKLEKEIERVCQINNVINILNWDIAVNIPLGSVSSRGEEIVTLSLMAQQILKSDKIADLYQQAIKESDQLNQWQLANLREIERKIANALCIDDNLQAKFISSTTQCELIWRQARVDNDYAKLKPYLQTVLTYLREIAKAKSKRFGCSNYDALIDQYDPDRKSSQIRKTFTILKKTIPDLTQRITDRQQSQQIIPLSEAISIDQQKLIAKRLMQIMDFDLTVGRLDESTHPFCSGTPYDVRLTNRYDQNNFLSAIMGIIHETGHGLYEQNLPTNYKNQFVGKAKGMAIHESQSLFMEMQVGRSKEFMEFFAKLLRDEFALYGPEYSSDNLYKLVTQVKQSFIRVDADEVTYPMHVILRYEIEEALINDDLTLDELPIYWNQKMHEYLGITPVSDKEGCLQDIHWPIGYFGYFPAYVNGAIIASMLMKTAKIIYPKTNQEILSGDFNNLNMFLNEHIRNLGSLKNTNDLIKDATGEGQVNPVIFIDYLKRKYLN